MARTDTRMIARHVSVYRSHALLSAQLSIPVVWTAHRPAEVKRAHSDRGCSQAEGAPTASNMRADEVNQAGSTPRR